jgi:predicted peptidase
MEPSSDSIHIDPGKQLPQSLKIHLDSKPAPRDVTIRYMLFAPRDYKADGKKWPLLLFLHGMGECSNDDLSRVKIHGPAHIVDSRSDFPFVVVTPQLPPPPGYKEGASYTSEQVIALASKAWRPEELIRLVDHVAAKMNIDPERIYVTGLSMGGYGTWRLVAEHPERFAAAVPICGGGEPANMASALRRVPIWAFHGAKDPVVPLAEGQRMADAVKRAGGDVRFTVYPDATHDSWTATYDNQEVYDWLLAHRLHSAK